MLPWLLMWLAGAVAAAEEGAPPVFDIKGPDWAAFGSPVDALHRDLSNSGKMVNIGGRTCFTADRSLLGSDWHVQVCSYNGFSTESVTLYLTKESCQRLEMAGEANGLGALYSKLRAALEGQYGVPAESQRLGEVWRDGDGDLMALWMGSYSLGSGWKTVYGVPSPSATGSTLAPALSGIILTYRQVPAGD